MYSAPTSVTINAQPATPAAPTAAGFTTTCAVATGTITAARLELGQYSIDGSTYTNTTGIFTNVAAAALFEVKKCCRMYLCSNCKVCA
jgi:hypothetical protein